jgi:3',5'-cyclic-AMP phosphodiesterase
MSSSVPRRRRVLHLSDIHLTASGVDEDGVDARASLRRILDDARFVPGVDLVVVSGDVADDGSAAGYADALEHVGSFAGDRGIPFVFCTGNHDDRDNFAAVLGSGHRDSHGVDSGVLMHAESRAAVSDIGGLRVITLDSLVPGAVPGRVADDQLDWLGALLARPAAAGSIVVLHHPPISLPDHPMRAFVLQNADSLARVLAGSDVHVVLCGHLHHQMSGSLGDVPVWVTPGVVTRIDLTSPVSLVRGVLGAGATVVDVGDGRPMFHLLHARDPGAGTQVYLYDAVSGNDVASEEAVTGRP